MLRFALVVLALAFVNASCLYVHQWRSDYWLPRTEDGTWRTAATKKWRSSHAKMHAENLGYASYAEMPEYLRNKVDAEFDERYPPAMIKRAERMNAFNSYVSIFGMWQWPLTIAATILCCFALIEHGRNIPGLIFPLVFVSLLLLADAWYRSYFTALGD